jgi:hypothetical protein
MATYIPYKMFDVERTARELKSAKTMERIYHKGQEKAWDGKAVLAELVKTHGGVQLDPEKIAPLRRLFATIFWGELAAWKVSSELALELEPLEAKMAASSQAHDEARHFYVMHDYLSLLDYTPQDLPPAAHRLLLEILQANSLAKKLLGMQLMVEPIALTLFQLVRENRLEPVLADLLAYYERDEARHIALGVNFLPTLIDKMSYLELADFYVWQVRMFLIQLDGVEEMEADFAALGFSIRDVVRLGMIKQLHAGRLTAQKTGNRIPAEELFTRAIEIKLALNFGDPDQTRMQRWQEALKIMVHNSRQARDVQAVLDRLDAGEMIGPAAAA